MNMNKSKFILLFSALFILFALTITGAFAWMTSEKSAPAPINQNIEAGYIGVHLQYRSYTVYDNGDGTHSDFYDLAGSPIPEPSNMPFIEWPLPPGASPSLVSSATPAPPWYDPSNIYKDRVAGLYPGSFYGEDGYPLDGVKGVIEYSVYNYSGTDAIVRMNQKGLWFKTQSHPIMNEEHPVNVNSVDLRWYRLKDEFFDYSDPPISLINEKGAIIPFLNYDRLRLTPPPGPYAPFIPYDIFNKYYYTTNSINMFVPESRAFYEVTSYDYGPDPFGLILEVDYLLDNGVKIAANGCAKCFYLYMPKDMNARFIYTFTAYRPTSLNSLVKDFRNDWAYSVLTLDTDSLDPQDNPELIASASEVNQNAFEYLFGSEDSYTVNENFNLNWTVGSISPTECPRFTKTPSPAATLLPNKTPRPSVTPKPTSTPWPTATPRPTFTPTFTPTPDIFRFVLDISSEKPDDYDLNSGEDNHVELDIGYNSQNEFSINWGDGSPIITFSKFSGSTYLETNRKHNYPSVGGPYTVTITGSLPGGICFGSIDWRSRGPEYRLIEVKDPMLPVNDIEFNNTFGGCTNLTKVPADLFKKNPGIQIFDGTFGRCDSLKTIPRDLFKYNQEAEEFKFTFWGSGLESIPAGLFDSNVNAKVFDATFAVCESITAPIPPGLFDHNTQALEIKSVFEGDYNLTGTIPPLLFRYNTEVLNLNAVFSGCESLSGTIPVELFSYNKKVKYLIYTFNDCLNLEGPLPADLFRNNTNVISFEQTFRFCLNIDGPIPVGFFNTAVKAKDFHETFSTCRKLESIPEGLFDYCSEVEKINYTFVDCPEIKNIPQNLLINIGSEVDLTGCFQGCIYLADKTVNIKLNPLVNIGKLTNAFAFDFFGNETGELHINIGSYNNEPAFGHYRVFSS